MSLHHGATDGPGVVLTHAPDEHDHASEHERLTHLAFARQLAALRGDRAGGAWQPAARPPGRVYFLPASPLGLTQAQALGIRGADDLFGGVVPHPFVASKVISHPLVAPGAAAVPGWNPAFGAQVADAVLDGWSVFSVADARRAGLRLLDAGPVRLKPARATGGQGQAVAHDRDELEERLQQLDPDELAAHGLVLEQDLQAVRTFSVGQVQVADLTASYYGIQRTTRDNRGEEVFGGSRLVVVRGGFDALLVHGAPPEIRRAVEQACRYDAAVQACWPDFFASRRNYDVAVGLDGAGRPRSGVLEQSWRAGGATGAELAALEAFRRDPSRQRVCTACIEVYGDSPEPPAGATVHFRGTDPQAGPLTKYTEVEPDADAH